MRNVEAGFSKVPEQLQLFSLSFTTSEPPAHEDPFIQTPAPSHQLKTSSDRGQRTSVPKHQAGGSHLAGPTGMSWAGFSGLLRTTHPHHPPALHLPSSTPLAKEE